MINVEKGLPRLYMIRFHIQNGLILEETTHYFDKHEHIRTNYENINAIGEVKYSVFNKVS